MNLATQLAVQELFKPKCLMQFIIPRAIFDSKFFHALSSWRNHNDNRATVHKIPFSLEQLSTIFTAWVTRFLEVSNVFHLSRSIAFLLKRGNIHVKNTEKPSFLIQNDDSIVRTALSEFCVNSRKFEHLSNQRTKTTLWLVRDTYPKRSDWCKQRIPLYTLT